MFANQSPQHLLHLADNRVKIQHPWFEDLLAAESQELAGQSGKGGNAAAAALVGKRVAEKALKAGIAEVAFDRSGFRYHGRVKAVAEAAREAGLKI